MKFLAFFFALWGVLSCADYGVYLEKEDHFLEIPDHQSTRLGYKSNSYLYIPYGAIEDEGVVRFRTSLRQGGLRGKELRSFKDFSALAWCYSKDYTSMLLIIDYWMIPEGGKDTQMREALTLSNATTNSLFKGELQAFDASLFSQFAEYGVGPVSKVTQKSHPETSVEFKVGKMEQVYFCYEIEERKAHTYQEGHLIDFAQINEYLKKVPQGNTSSNTSQTSHEEEQGDPRVPDYPQKFESSPSRSTEEAPYRTPIDKLYEEQEEEGELNEYDENGYRKYQPYY
jgi:hypothetical protein